MSALPSKWSSGAAKTVVSEKPKPVSSNWANAIETKPTGPKSTGSEKTKPTGLKSTGSEKSKPLPSKWATANDTKDQAHDESTKPKGRNRNHQRTPRRRSSHSRSDTANHDKHNVNSRSDTANHDKHNVNSRSNTANHDKHNVNSRSDTANHDKHNANNRANNKSRTSDKGNHLPSPPPTANRDEETEPAPMTHAGKEFASRLGLGTSSHKSIDNKPKNLNNKKELSSKTQEDDQWESEDEEGHHSDGNDEPSKEPMSAAGMAFASRLGMANSSASQAPNHNNNHSKMHNTSQKNTHNNPKSNEPGSLASRLSQTSIHDDKKPPTGPSRSTGGKSKYQTPKQRREEIQKEQERRALEEKKHVDEKLQAEVRQMFEKMEDKSFNWADLEDEDE